MLLNRTPGAGLLNRYEYVFLELFINRRIRSFLSHQKTMQFTNIIKTTVIISLQASANVQYASVDFPEGKIWCRPGKIR